MNEERTGKCLRQVEHIQVHLVILLQGFKYKLHNSCNYPSGGSCILMFNLETLLTLLIGIICRDQYILATVWTDIYSLYIEYWFWFILIWSWIYSNGSQIKVFLSASFTPISPWHIAIVLLFTVHYYIIILYLPVIFSWVSISQF